MTPTTNDLAAEALEAVAATSDYPGVGTGAGAVQALVHVVESLVDPYDAVREVQGALVALTMTSNWDVALDWAESLMAEVTA